MTALPETKTEPKSKIDSVTLEIPALSRSAIDELYHFLQYLQFKHQIDLEPAIETIEDEIDSFDIDVARQEPGEAIPLEKFKEELGLD